MAEDISGVLDDLESWKALKVSWAENQVAHEFAKWAAAMKFSIGFLGEGQVHE